MLWVLAGRQVLLTWIHHAAGPRSHLQAAHIADFRADDLSGPCTAATVLQMVQIKEVLPSAEEKGRQRPQRQQPRWENTAHGSHTALDNTLDLTREGDMGMDSLRWNRLHYFLILATVEVGIRGKQKSLLVGKALSLMWEEQNEAMAKQCSDAVVEIATRHLTGTFDCLLQQMKSTGLELQAAHRYCCGYCSAEGGRVSRSHFWKLDDSMEQA